LREPARRGGRGTLCHAILVAALSLHNASDSERCVEDRRAQDVLAFAAADAGHLARGRSVRCVPEMSAVNNGQRAEIGEAVASSLDEGATGAHARSACLSFLSMFCPSQRVMRDWHNLRALPKNLRRHGRRVLSEAFDALRRTSGRRGVRGTLACCPISPLISSSLALHGAAWA